MIYFMPIYEPTIPNYRYYDPNIEPPEYNVGIRHHKGAWVPKKESGLDFMKNLLNTKGNKDIFVFVSAFNKGDYREDTRQTPILMKILEEHDLTKHIHYERKGLTNQEYIPGAIDLFILTRKTRTSASRITLENLNAL
jgi:hypothetical protein